MALLISGILVAIMLILGQSVKSALAAERFCYKDKECGPTTWGGMCQSGKNQSPIDIPMTPIQMLTARRKNLTFSPGCAQPQNITLQAVGEIPRLKLEGGQASNCSITGDLLNGTYIFAGMDVHLGDLGSGINNGSEHSINGQKFAMEIQMIFYKANYTNLAEALNSTNRESSMAVIGALVHLVETFIQTQSSMNIGMSDGGIDAGRKSLNITITKVMASIQRENTMVYQYKGSMTAPPCTENVLWTVFNPVEGITESQLKELRSLKGRDGETLADNNRPLQPRGRRTMNYFHLNMDTAAGGHD